MPSAYGGVPVPKGKTRRQIKRRKDREDAKRLRHFRNLVWLRECERTGNFAGNPIQYAQCQHCHALVMRGSLLEDAPLTGEVHHRISRRHKAMRYDPDNGVLLCNHLVNNCHEKAQHGEIDV
jgi:hypothetical protein